MQALPESAVDSREARLACLIAQSPPGQAADAEAQLYRLLAPRVRRYGLRHLRDPHAAQDLMQQVMTLTIEQLRAGRVREPERVVSFVLGSCRMSVMHERRSRARHGELLERYGDPEPTASVEATHRLDHERVVACLERLAQRERSVLVLTFYDDQPADAVATQLGLSAGNVRVIRHRGIDKLRRCVDAHRRPP
ncbi:sigma-70 family RNA polymerase sigma factor [Ramlibacter sp. AW1]|uniref:Sigma-70 family RNA polymerase sigma factor n=1 Tax=Ramlibacter aurantiacus TaxID=2801330 RepID=A0A937D8R8_9BURK|nr:sigma-70 family RNA polymerase sigma factor [Ramlibacter aurantiacus]MBL0423338.1 sigma-70 family RNA polymerase sigma factor [Ramlibacter aurantiacus]